MRDTANESKDIAGEARSVRVEPIIGGLCGGVASYYTLGGSWAGGIIVGVLSFVTSSALLEIGREVKIRQSRADRTK